MPRWFSAIFRVITTASFSWLFLLWKCRITFLWSDVDFIEWLTLIFSTITSWCFLFCIRFCTCNIPDQRDTRTWTIDSISLFSLLQNSELWLIAEDYTANNDKELTVTKGQKVEITENSPGGVTGDWCLVRIVNADDTSTGQEGLLPVSALKPLPNLRVSSSHDKFDNEGTTSRDRARFVWWHS